jgi:hypothetical protein
MRIFVSLIIIMLSSAAFAADESKATHWWDIATGVLAIPTALFGIVLAYATLTKTNLESKKIELELREKQATIANTPGIATPESDKIAQSLINPLIDNNRVNYLILRFVVIYLILQFWEIFQKVFNLLVGGTFLSLQKVFGLSIEGLPTLIFFGLTQVVQFSWIILVLLLGLPLYRDISTHIGFRILKRPKL